MSFAVLTPIGLLVEGGTESYGNFDWFNADDEFILRQHYAAIGYQFELGEGWYIVPKAGRAKWKLTSEEGWLCTTTTSKRTCSAATSISGSSASASASTT